MTLVEFIKNHHEVVEKFINERYCSSLAGPESLPEKWEVAEGSTGLVACITLGSGMDSHWHEVFLCKEEDFEEIVARLATLSKKISSEWSSEERSFYNHAVDAWYWDVFLVRGCDPQYADSLEIMKDQRLLLFERESQ